MYNANFRQPISFDYDLIVIGSGMGGSIAAHTAVNLNKKVCIIESGMLGGECPNNSCIPTKALLEVAKTIDTVNSAAKHGINIKDLVINYETVQAFKDKAIANTGTQNESKAYKHSGIDVVKGSAHFINPWQVNVGVRRISAKKFIIATGSSPIVPNIKGLAETGYLTSSELCHIPKIPKSIAIIGGGAVAYEYAQICSALGAKIHIIETADHIVPYEDPELSDLAESELLKRGVRVHTSSKIDNITKGHKDKVISFIQNGLNHRIITEEILLASGKSPNTNIGLENTGIKYTKNGILVDKYLRTNQKHIFAVGDVTGENLSSHAAAYESRIAVHNIYKRKKQSVKNAVVPRVIYGVPELASVGVTERHIKMTGVVYQTSIAPIGLVGKSLATDYSAGFVKIIATQNGTVIGGSIVAPHASELISELTLAIQYRHRACDLANLIHPFPTWSEAIRVASSKILCI